MGLVSAEEWFSTLLDSNSIFKHVTILDTGKNLAIV
jgi:hypothetical protein